MACLFVCWTIQLAKLREGAVNKLLASCDSLFFQEAKLID